MMRATTLGLAVALVLAGGTTATAQTVVWDNGPYMIASGFDATNNALADDFTLAGATTIHRIRFWAESGDVFMSGFSGTIGWAIHQNGVGIPGAVLFSGTNSGAVGLTPTGDGVGDAMIWELDFSVGAPINLAAGTYWLQLHENGIGAAADGSPIVWAPRQNGILGLGQRLDPNEVNPVTWPIATGMDGAFQLIAAVPEPTTLLLGTLGLTGAVWTARKRRLALHRRCNAKR